MLFRSTALIYDDPRFKGEWVAIPGEDFKAFRALLDPKEEA